MNAQERDQILIVGAGPVGMILANLLAAMGLRCLILDRRTELPSQSRAIGVTPPTLALLSRVGLSDALVKQGVKVRDAVVHDGQEVLGSLTFRHLPGDFPYILSVPQRVTMEVLQSGLRRSARVELRLGEEFVELSPLDRRIRMHSRVVDTTGTREYEGALLVGCDGHRSAVRDQGRFRPGSRAYRVAFFMADFRDRTNLGHKAHLFFTPRGAVESFPLPQQRRRWIAQTDAAPDHLNRADLVACIHQRTGHRLDAADATEVSWFRPERLDCNHFCSDGVLLCGDAAHVMSPIGGQGMNTGFADASAAARAIGRWGRGEPWATLQGEYDRCRQRAFRTAAARASLGMWIGTRQGASSRVRSHLLKRFLALRPVARRLSMHFAMMRERGMDLGEVDEEGAKA